MLTSDIRSQIDAIWNAFWSGGISNPMEVLEQITYLLFIRRLDDAHTLEESKALLLKQPMAKRIFPEGKDALGRSYDDLRWSRFKNFVPAEMFTVVGEREVPFLRNMGGDGSTYSQHMKDARFTIPTSGLLAKVVDILDHVPMEDRDTKGDLYPLFISCVVQPSSLDSRHGGWWRAAQYQPRGGQESKDLASPFTRAAPHRRHPRQSRRPTRQAP